MMIQITNMIFTVIGEVNFWFYEIFNALGAFSYFISAITIYMVIRFLIAPITGPGSDRASKKQQKEDSE